jgi:hypothetical protein
LWIYGRKKESKKKKKQFVETTLPFFEFVLQKERQKEASGGGWRVANKMDIRSTLTDKKQKKMKPTCISLHVLRTYLYTYLCGRLSYLTILGSQ